MRRTAARLACAGLGAAVLIAAAIACDLGLDVDGLERGCPGCSDAATDATDASPGAMDAASDVSTTDAAQPAPCPSLHGSPMQRVALRDGTAFCIDELEVTNDDYAAFLDGGADAGAPSAPGCDPAESYVPQAGWPPIATRGKNPVSFVRWCAARAYCAWAGKHLCGGRTGGALDVTLVGRPEHDTWTAACSNEGAATYPYATAYVASACNGDQYGVHASVPVGSIATCAAPDGGPRDLSGNLWEWIDACDATGFCFAHGGAFNSPESELTCTSALRAARDGGLDTVGLRCCSAAP
ncbi:MAG: hypothetical protein JWP87_5500 [Labilithrix sp.]|nr:hypothetical protein [Labilithrix sp.]